MYYYSWKSHAFVHSELRARASLAEGSQAAAPCQAVLVPPPPKDGSKDKEGKKPAEAVAMAEDRDVSGAILSLVAGIGSRPGKGQGSPWRPSPF